MLVASLVAERHGDTDGTHIIVEGFLFNEIGSLLGLESRVKL